jgi:hypothetical protein
MTGILLALVDRVVNGEIKHEILERDKFRRVKEPGVDDVVPLGNQEVQDEGVADGR